jgi:hypothetical protein
MRDTRPRHWNSRKMNHVLSQYLFNQRSCPTTIKCIHRTRCSKFTRFPCIPTREDVWRHCRVVINRVVPWEVDHPIHNNQLSDRPSRSHDGTWDEQTIQATSETGRVPIKIILPLKFFVISVPCFLPTSLLSNLGMRFSLRVVTPRITESLIKLIKLQLSLKVRVNQVIKVWNQNSMSNSKIEVLFSVDRLT